MNKNQPWNILRFKGTRSWDSLTGGDSVAVVDNATHPYTVKLELAATHYLTIGGHVTIDGSTNYDGTYEILAGSTTKYINILHKYIAEDMETTVTFKLTLAPGVPFEFGGFRLTLDDNSATAENMTITVDAGAGSVYDYQLYFQDMNTIKHLNWDIKDNPELFDKDDELDFAWGNTNQEPYGLEIFWRRR